MSKYIIRLDDACEKRNQKNWKRVEELLDKFNIRPLVGLIPHCEDKSMDNYTYDNDFWTTVNRWKDKGWVIALHGYNHVYTTSDGGINPVNFRSEFAGEPFEVQKEKIIKGVAIMRQHNLEPRVFFAPSHTFDINTIECLKQFSNIRIVSDTIANEPYTNYGITFVPQQSGRVRKLPFKYVTFCYHPNTMVQEDFLILERFLIKNSNRFIDFPMKTVTKKLTIYDKVINFLYFFRRKIK